MNHPPVVCSVEGCGRIVKAKGYCNKHHLHWTRHGYPVAIRKGAWNNGMRKCPRCGESKSPEEFPVKERATGKRHSFCRPCLTIYEREWQRTHRDLVREQKRRYREKHPEEVKAAKRRLYHTDIEKHRAQQRDWAAAHPERVAERNAAYAYTRRWAQLREDFGMSPDDYIGLWNKQSGLCAICRRELANRRLSREEIADGLRSAHVDHDHSTGAVRGLLCGNCNQALGLFADDLERLSRARAYLIRCMKSPTGFAVPPKRLARLAAKAAEG